jgi:hypothetical protein
VEQERQSAALHANRKIAALEQDRFYFICEANRRDKRELLQLPRIQGTGLTSLELSPQHVGNGNGHIHRLGGVSDAAFRNVVDMEEQ